MLENIPAWLGITATLFGLTAVAASAFAIFGSNWSKSRNMLKDEIIKDSRERITQLESNENRLESERDLEKNKRLVLEGVVTGKDELFVIQNGLSDVKKELSGVNNKLDTLINIQSGKAQ